MQSDLFWELLTRYLSKEASLEEMEQLKVLIQQDDSCREAFERATTQWQKKAPVIDYDQEKGHQLLQEKLQKQLPEPVQPEISPAPGHTGRFYWPVAACILLLLGISLLGYTFLRTPPARDTKILVERAAYGMRKEIVLPDQTHVWLNAGSELRYRPFRGEKSRVVQLTGEAFFDVKRDPHTPFIIETGPIQIKVLGTRFNVRAYQDEKQQEVVVAEGKVAVAHSGNAAQPVVLLPNQKVIADGLAFQLMQADATDASWVEGKLIFRRETLANVLKTLSRQYNVSFDLENENLRNCLITASFENESLPFMLTVMLEATGGKYRMNGRRIVLSGEGCP